MSWSRRARILCIALGLVAAVFLLYALAPPVSENRAEAIAKEHLISRGMELPADATARVIPYDAGLLQMYLVAYHWERKLAVIPSREDYARMRNAIINLPRESHEAYKDNATEAEIDAEVAEYNSTYPTYEELVAAREADPSVFPFRIDVFLEAKTGKVLYVFPYT